MPRVRPDRHRALPGEIAQPGRSTRCCARWRLGPVIRRWGATSRRTGVGHRLVPAHAGDRMILLAREIVTRLPGRRPGAAGPVGHQRHGRLPRNRPPVLHEGFLPQLPALVPAAVHEPPELRVGHLEAIHEIVAQRDRLDVLERRIEHVELAARAPGPSPAGARCPDQAGSPNRGEGDADQVERAVTRGLDPQAVRVEIEAAAPAQRQQQAVERCLARGVPRRSRGRRTSFCQTEAPGGSVRMLTRRANRGRRARNSESSGVDRLNPFRPACRPSPTRPALQAPAAAESPVLGPSVARRRFLPRSEPEP